MPLRNAHLDLSEYQLPIVVSEPQPKIDFETKGPKKNADGETLFTVGLALVANDFSDAEVIDVTVTCALVDIRYGAMVQVEGLAVSSWDMGERNGHNFKARNITVLFPPANRTAPGGPAVSAAPGAPGLAGSAARGKAAGD
jgi:hypothetical protein